MKALAAVPPGVALVSLAATLLDLPRADVIDALDSDRYCILWIMGSYLVGAATGMCTTSLSAGLLGLRRAYLAGLLLFTLAGGACGFVSEVVWMTPLRLLQGLGAGMVLSPGMLLVWRAFPERRDAAMAAYGLAVYLAAIAGAVLGGLLTAWLSWRWLFWINLPLGCLMMVVTGRLLPPEPRPREPVRFDLVGFMLFLTWLVALNVTLDMGQYWGWVNSPFFVPWFAAFVLSFGGFIAWGILHPQPLISLRPFARRNFALGIVLKVLLTIDVTVLAALTAAYLIDLRGYQWWQGSLVVLPGLAAFVAAAAGSVPWARAANRRMRILLGLAAVALAAWGLSFVDLYTSKYATAALLMVWGAGAGLAVAPILAVIFDGLTPAETLQGAGVFNITRAIPAFAAGALLVTLLTQQTDAQFDRLRLRITRNRPLVVETLRRSQVHFSDRGSPVGVQDRRAHAFLGRWVHANARAYAFQDVLVMLALATAAAGPLVLAVRSPSSDPADR